MPNRIAIFAVSENHVIGKDQDLPWKLPADLRRFKQLTTGWPMLMGRLTFEGLGAPLPNRRHLIVSSQLNPPPEGTEVFPSLQQALEACKESEKVFLIGGAKLLKAAFAEGVVDEVYETLVHAEVEGDTFLPPDWQRGMTLVGADAQQADDRNEFAFTYRDWKKKTAYF